MRGEQVDQRLPRWLRASLGSVGDVILFAALSLAIWTVLPAVALGATPVIISGGSMSPLIRAGDVILLDDAPPPEGEVFAPGTVITFESSAADGSLTGELVTHRVERVVDGEYVTRGDANTSADLRSVHPDQLVGVGRWLVPLVGLPAHWARTGSWHLVLATVLVGLAAVAASLAGRRRIVIEEAEELEDEPIVHRPLEPSLPEPILAFALESDGEPDEAAFDDDALEPAAAERAASVAAQAARRSMAGLDQVREEEREDDEQDRSAPRRRHGGAGGAGGSAPIAAVVALALALLGTTLAPTFAAAAYVATTSNGGNSFTTGEAQPYEELVFVLPAHPAGTEDGTLIAAPHVQHPGTFSWSYTTTRPLELHGSLITTVEVRPNTQGGGHARHVDVALLVGSATQPHATGRWSYPTNGSGWVRPTFALSPAVSQTIPAGTELRIEVTLDRLEMRVGGPSVVVFPIG